MNLDVFLNFLFQPMILTLAIVLLIIISAMVFRRWQRRRAIHQIKAMPIRVLPNATERDREAYELLRKMRAELWREWEAERDFSRKTFYDVAFSVVRPIASLYFPEDDQPHLRARFEDLVRLNNRIYSRAQTVLDKPFLNKLRRMDIDAILKLRRGMTLVMGNPIVQFVRNKDFRRHWANLFAAINVLNPWYWFRRFLTEYSFELAFRYFFSFFVTVIGEEAVLLFGRPQMDDPEHSIDLITGHCILAMLTGRERNAEEYNAFYDWLLHETSLDSDERLGLLQQMYKGNSVEIVEKEVSLLSEIDGQDRCLDVLERIALAGGLTEEKEKIHNRVIDIFNTQEGRP